MSASPRGAGLHFGPEDRTLVEAARKFKAALDPKHAQDFEESTRALVCGDLRLLQAQQQETNALMNLRRVQMFLDGVTSLQTVLTELGFPEVGEVMACIWGPMRFLFKTANVNERALDHILEVYQRLGLQILDLTEYRQLFAACPPTRIALVYIYQDILSFHAIAYKLFSLRSSLWAKLQRATWRDLENTFDHLAATLKQHAHFIEQHGSPLRDRHAGAGARTDSGYFDGGPVDLSAREIHRYKSEYDQARHRFGAEETQRKLNQKERVLRWVDAPGKTEQLHASFRQTRALCPESGSWIWGHHDEVSNWMTEDPPAYSTVWVHGRKGLGKTTLASHIVDNLRSRAAKPDDGDGDDVPDGARVCYFYCQDQDDELAKYLGILKGLLHQLVSAAAIVTDEGGDDNNGDAALLLLPFCEDKVSSTGGSTLQNAETAQQLLEVLFEHGGPRLYVVVDGLDECAAATEVQQTVDFLTKQVARCDALAQGRLRVLLVSQSTTEMRKVMARCGRDAAGVVELEADDNKEDIRLFVRRKLRTRYFNLSPDDEQVIEDRVVNQSEGLFLYAHLAMEYLLKQMTKRDLLSKVGRGMLPDGIAKMYDELLATIKARLEEKSPQHWEKAKLLLGWLVCAHRPLKWHEIQAILAFDPDSQVVDFDMGMIREDNIDDFLGSLVQVLKGDNIRLLHSTAREHLVNTRYIRAESVQCDLAALCLRYLSLRCFAAPDYPEDERRTDIVHGYFSFQDYATAQWWKHVTSVIQHCRSVFPASGLPPDAYHDDHYTVLLSESLDAFVSAYDGDLRPLDDVHPDLPADHLAPFQDLPFHAALARLYNHIYTHQNRPLEERNRLGIPRLDAAVAASRALIELDHARPGARTLGADTMAAYYGPNAFKCPRALCRFYHDGFAAARDRDAHRDRHDRPYVCPRRDCSFAPFGFSSGKDQQRHVRTYHPDLGDGPSAFLQMTRRVEQARFRCNICSKSFTRNINLKGHERSHFGERPYACSTCGKAFARLNDCRRHEKIHKRNAA
ncbi:Early growth response protein 1 [Colletotrichum orbiculare MAFF 240422]|uniref:Early growth response protein 1 n=1 Tax=Colletotrichum orbiculare (strain 104-T / ATCC 96160 / CBS 514.97 / LARS 414 / MAFF 240422) TaxID=1213857 RepID=N4VVZ2_COLOR|nr:Early growth response protein 1 [Colletotrichum orbiculare MAFF 240422]